MQTPLASTAVTVVESGRNDARLNDSAPGSKGTPQQAGAPQQDGNLGTRQGPAETRRLSNRCATGTVKLDRPPTVGPKSGNAGLRPRPYRGRLK